MTKVEVKENGQPVSQEGVYYLKHTGNFNYFVTVEVRGQPQSSSSSLLLYCYSNIERTNVIATLFRYRRKKNDSFEVIHNRSNCHRCSVKDMQSYIEIKITPSEEDYFGECILIYGQVELDAVTKSRYKKAKLTEGFQLECSGRADNARELNIIRFEGGQLLGLDSTLKEVKRLAIQEHTRLLPSSFDGKKLKVLNRAGTDELDLNFVNESDKDLALLLIEHKKKLVREGRDSPFVIKKQGDNRVYQNQRDEPSLNDTFQDNLHSLTGLLNRTDSAEPMELGGRGNPVNAVNGFQARQGSQQQENIVREQNRGQLNPPADLRNQNQDGNNSNARVGQRVNKPRNSRQQMSKKRNSSPLQVNINRKRLSEGQRPPRMVQNNKNKEHVRTQAPRHGPLPADRNIQNRILHEVDGPAESPLEQELLQIPQVKHVDSQNGSEILMNKNTRQNFQKNNPPKQYEKVVAFDPNALNASSKSEKNSASKYKPMSNSKPKFRPHFQRKRQDLSQEILKFDGLEEEELDRRLNNAFKKEHIQVQKGGRAYLEPKDPNKTDSFFKDVEFSREYGAGKLNVPQRFSERVKGSALPLPRTNGSEYRTLYHKLNNEYEGKELKKENLELRESQIKSQKKMKRLTQAQKGLIREIKMLRAKNQQNENEGEILEAQKQIQMKKQLKTVTEKWRESRKLYEGEKLSARESMVRLEAKSQRILELETAGVDLKRSLQIKEGELARVAESKGFFKKKVGQMEQEKNKLQEELKEKEQLRNMIEAKDFEIQNGETNLRNMKISIYEIEVNEKILEQQFREARGQISGLKKELQVSAEEKQGLQAELRTTKRLQHEMGRELKLRKGAGILEEEKAKLRQEARQFEEFSRKKDSEIGRLRVDLEQAKEEKRAVERFYTGKRGEKEEMLMAEIKDWERDAERHERKIVDLQFDIDLERRESQQHIVEIERLRKDAEKYKLLETEYLRTVQQINEDQERMSRRSEGLRNLDESKDKLISKLQQKLRNQKKIEHSLARNLESLNAQIDDNRQVHVEYIDTINRLKKKLSEKTEQVEALEEKKTFGGNVSRDSFDLPFRKDEDIIMENITVEQSIDVSEPIAFADIKRTGLGLDYMRAPEFQKVLEISKNEEFMFQSNHVSISKAEMRFGSGDPHNTYQSATDEFQRKKEIAEKDVQIEQLKKVTTGDYNINILTYIHRYECQYKCGNPGFYDSSLS